MQTNETPNGQEKSGKKASSKAEKTESPPKSDAPASPALVELDLDKPVDIKMVRCAELTLDHQSGSKALTVGNYTANNGGLDGVVHRMLRHSSGVVVATIRKQRRHGDLVTTTDKHMLIQGTLECEVMTEEERAKRGFV